MRANPDQFFGYQFLTASLILNWQKTKPSKVSYVISPFILYILLFKIFPDWQRADTADVSTGVRGTDWRGKNNHSVFFLSSNSQFWDRNDNRAASPTKSYLPYPDIIILRCLLAQRINPNLTLSFSASWLSHYLKAPCTQQHWSKSLNAMAMGNKI